MFALTLKDLAARKLRILATAFAVLLGVAFMAGTLIFTDTIGATFDNALAEANAGVDAYVRTPSAIDIAYGEPGPRLDASLVDEVAAVPGVDQVALRINGYAQIVGPDGEPVGDIANSPAFGTNWIAVDELNPYDLVAGHAPSDDEIVIDKASADKAGVEPGDVVTVLTKGAPRDFTIAGIATFAGSDSPAGATAVLFSDATATELLAMPGQADAIAVTADDGISQAALAAAVQAAVGDDVEVITGSALIAEDQESMASLLSEFKMLWLIFAAVGVIVGAFIINNTFSITVAQRTREMAMLRAVGASGRQVKRSVLLEAFVVGAVASAIGLVAGVGIAAGLRGLMAAFGFEMPEGDTVISTSSMLISFAIGTGVTVLSAWLPARRAAKIAPIAALRDISVDRAGSSAKRAVIGTVLVAGGIAAVVSSVDGDTGLLALGALSLLAGTAIIGPVLARPVTALVGVIVRRRGISGDLATRNAARNPKRTARTAASLMIGVALVGFITVFAASAKTSLAGSLDSEFRGTHIVATGGTDSASGLSPDLADELRRTPGVDIVTQARVTPAVVGPNNTRTFYAFDGDTVGSVFDLGTIEGDLASLGADGLAVSDEVAADEGWTLGTQVPATFPHGSTTLVVKAIYSGATEWVSSMFVDNDALRANGGEDLDYRLYVSGDEAAITSVASAYATADVLDKDGFLAVVSDEINTMLGIFYVLLMLAVVIALLGIANTLALSTFERTKELGLLRAVGMTRSQVRSTVRWESIVIALFGTVLGLALGTFFGWAIVRLMSDQGIDTLTVPYASLGMVTVIAAVAGAGAAVLPARRAAELDVLTAVAAA